MLLDQTKNPPPKSTRGCGLDLTTPNNSRRPTSTASQATSNVARCPGFKFTLTYDQLPSLKKPVSSSTVSLPAAIANAQNAKNALECFGSGRSSQSLLVYPPTRAQCLACSYVTRSSFCFPSAALQGGSRARRGWKSALPIFAQFR
jgi:hypothetical protein